MSKQCSNQLSYPPGMWPILYTKSGRNDNPCGIIHPVSKPRHPEDLSEYELRRLLLDKRRGARQVRLERFRRTGRAVTLAPDLPKSALDDWRTEPGLDKLDGDSTENVPKTSRRRKIMDRLLLVVELLAVVGLLGVLANGLGLLRTLNAEVAAALRQETLTPTPLITAIVLPSGHTPPTDPGGVQPNESEIPEHLRPLVQSLANIPIPTPGPEQAVRIQIPAIGVDAPVVQGDGWEQLKKGVGQHVGSGDPGKTGNLILSAHNDVFGEIFRDLDRLQPGDMILVYSAQRQYVYVITETRIVEPTRVEVMASTASPTVTLISCYPYMVDNRRIVVFANLQNP